MSSDSGASSWPRRISGRLAGIDEAVPKVVDPVWCLAMLVANPAPFDRIVSSDRGASLLDLLRRDIVMAAIEDEIASGLEDFAAGNKSEPAGAAP